MGTTKMELTSKNAVQILFFALLLNYVVSARTPGRQTLSPIQEAPQYRFHYYVQDEGTGNNGVSYKTHEEYKNAAVSSFSAGQSGPVYKADAQTPIVVQPIDSQAQQKTSKSIDVASKNEESGNKEGASAEQAGTEDRQDDDKEVSQEQVFVQDKDETMKQPTEFTIPFKKPNSVGADDIKYGGADDEAMKKDIVKVIQNINGAGIASYGSEQSDSQLNFKSGLTDKPMKTVNVDSAEADHADGQQQAHINFKSQQLSNKPLRLFGYNPWSTFGQAYDVDNNRPPQVASAAVGGYYAGYGEDSVKTLSSFDLGPAYSYLTGPTAYQYAGGSGAGYKGGSQKYNSAAAQQLYYYDPSSMLMVPIYTNPISGGQTYQTYTENGVNAKPQQQPQPQQQPAAQTETGTKKGFNLMQILSGGTFYKGSSEQAEGSQTTAVKDVPTKQEVAKPDKQKLSDEYDKTKQLQTLMLYLNPADGPLDIKSLTSSPIQLMLGQQPPQNDCVPKTKTPAVKEKPLQPIPLCSDCVPALGLIGLPNTKSVAIQTKKSSAPQPQVMPIWNGSNISKLNYLILPNPITK
ncbi:uncharacterized protein LOC126840283 [Adelges cooleyi]|uniref:uncharacterized protein LOC126840283 n=1 Tax=Adelges cooleyi TaxID=133065 RepID=UPI00217F811F|nr:uncharacterized protein LOC126840283 [Adelges cooleyi]